eukprot:913217-Prorocentrum_minimum.AAC.3
MSDSRLRRHRSELARRVHDVSPAAGMRDTDYRTGGCNILIIVRGACVGYRALRRRAVLRILTKSTKSTKSRPAPLRGGGLTGSRAWR